MWFLAYKLTRPILPLSSALAAWIVSQACGADIHSSIAGLLIGMGMIGDSNADKYKWLKQNGVHIQAKVLYISLEATSTLQGPMRPGGMTSPFRPPYLAQFQIVCEGVDPSNQSTKTYFSDTLTSHPDLKITPDTTLGVYVDKDDPSVYWVNLSDINFDNNFPNFPSSFIQFSAKLRSYDGVNYQKM